MNSTQVAAEDMIAELQAAAYLERVPYQGMRVHWRCWGEGPPLVLLHGGHGSWLHWVRNIDTLAAKHAVWVPDLPGFGDSDALAEPGDYAALLQATTATLDDVLGAGTPVDLAGFSFGALVAAELAQARAGVRRLALIGPAGHGSMRRQKLVMINWRQAANPEALEAALHNNLASLMLFDPAKIDDLALQVQARSNRATRFHSKPVSRSARLHAVLQGVTIPTLLLWGAHDVTAQPGVVAQTLLAGHPERQHRILPGAGHWVQYEAAAASNSLLGDWFARA